MSSVAGARSRSAARASPGPGSQGPFESVEDQVEPGLIRPIAVLGLIGYPVLLVGGILAAFELSSVTQGGGLVAVVPGGPYEVILPIWLITRGFKSSTSA